MHHHHQLWMLLLTLSFFLGSLVTLISCHPLQKKEDQLSSSSSNEQEDRIQVDLFSQLLSTHWQFDHLDTIMSQSHKQIADHIQNHIDIDIQPPHQEVNPSLSSFELSSSSPPHQQQQPLRKTTMRPFDHMEYDLLKSQMMNAIQARTQGLLPEMWDQVGEALGRPAIETYVQDLLRSACPHHQEWVALSCLDQHARDLSTKLDNYVQHHLTDLWTRFQQDLLPALLDSTVKELESVVDYFNNEAFFAPPTSQQQQQHQQQQQQQQQHRIIVNALPWSANLLPMDLVSLSSLDDHSLFSNFVTLAKI